MRTHVLGTMLLCLAVVGSSLADSLDYLGWSEDFACIARWREEPSWLSNDSDSPSASTDGQVAEFRVPEPNRGMKWSTSLGPLLIADTPFLLVRYRAKNLKTRSDDYLVHLDDGEPGQLNALRLRDVKDDGRWHVAAVDLPELTDAEQITGLAVQVQAGSEGSAALWFDWIRFAVTVPSDVEWPRGAPDRNGVSKWPAPLAQSTWNQQPSWLNNPASPEQCAARKEADRLVFRVEPAERGMKWSWQLAEPVELKGHRYVSLRCRASGMKPWSDYLVAALGKRANGEAAYTTLVPVQALSGSARWQTVNVDLRQAAEELATVETIAVQVQAAEPNAMLQISHLQLASAVEPTRLADVLPWKPGATGDGLAPVSIADEATADGDDWVAHLTMDRWFNEQEVTIEGLPFWLGDDAQLAATSLRKKGALRFETDMQAAEVYLLLLAAMVGPDEPMFGSGSLKAIRDVDRFHLRLEYTDGTADECLPWNVTLNDFGVIEGAQVVVAAADPAKRLRAVVLADRSRQAAFAVAAITARTGDHRAYPQALDDVKPLRHPGGQSPARLEFDCSGSGPPMLRQLVHRPSGRAMLARPCNLVELKVDGKTIAPEALRQLAAPADSSSWRWYAVDGAPGLRVGISIEPDEDVGLRFVAELRNEGGSAHDVDLIAPVIGPYRLSEAADAAHYLLPRRGALLNNVDTDQSHRYSGLFPLQFVDTFNPADRCGLTLRTEDRNCLRKHYRLKKERAQFTLGVEYPQCSLVAGGRFRTAPTVVAATDGHWRRGLNAYRRWLEQAHAPRVPRKPWFREIFNFRQRFLYWNDPLVNAETRQIELQRAVDEARREFGGIDYLHIFDWGNCGPYGRIYGRTGDYSPDDYLPGGLVGLREEIDKVQKQGVPVGLYIEGYLLTERGRLGQRHGAAWQLIGKDGTRRYWPGDVEMFVCPAVEAWREVQASTYAAKVRELNVDGMYIDQFGFAGALKDCWSTEHGHPVPSYSVVAERDTTLAIRDRIESAKSGVALYTEETPVDVTTQYQDGSFTYAMLNSLRHGGRVPLNLSRFAVPDFKTIEILFCDKPTGSWATGVRWVFFNGEAIWLEGPAEGWFEPETRQTIRRCYRILRKHRDAFTTLRPVPLVETLAAGVYANAFPVEGKTVYTLYNSRRRTVRSAVLRVEAAEGDTYHDAWHDRPAEVQRDGQTAVLSTEIGPQGVGCLVIEGP